jgi:hypothetical protein
MVSGYYTCHRCGMIDVEFEVRDRGPNEDVLVWLEAVKIAMDIKHARTAPLCNAPYVDLKIPIQAPRIGGPAVTVH